MKYSRVHTDVFGCFVEYPSVENQELQNQIIQGDCVEVLRQVKDASIDLCLFSPPYDQVRDYKGFELDLDELGRQLFRVSKDGAVVACVINDGTADFKKSLTSFRLACNWVDLGFHLFETIIYSRHGRPGAWWNQRFRVDHEYLFLFFRGTKPKFFDKSHLAVPAKYAGTEWHGTDRLSDGSTVAVQKGRQMAGTKCRGTIWHYAASNTEGNPIKQQHPATFPDQLAMDVIQTFSTEGELVLDPTCGSGTTCVVAANLKRHFIGIELAEDYAKIARARLTTEVIKSMFDED
jgi:DNA modification methylase